MRARPSEQVTARIRGNRRHRRTSSRRSSVLELPRVQQHPRRRHRRAVAAVADDRALDRLQMDADLVRAAGEDLRLDQRHPVELLAAAGRSCARPSRRSATRSSSRGRSSLGDGEVRLADLARGEQRRESAAAALRAREDHHAAGLRVDAMHEIDRRRSGRAAAPRASAVAVARRLGRHPGGLVDGDPVARSRG